MVFPGSELVGRIDESGLYVDWAMRLSVRASAAVAAKNQRALRNLNEQFGQREGDEPRADTSKRVASDLAQYVAILELKLEVGSPSHHHLLRRRPRRRHSPRRSPRPVRLPGRRRVQAGATAGIPGTAVVGHAPGRAVRRAVQQFAQITTSKALAVTIPLASVALGDTKGSLLGEHLPWPLAGPKRALWPDQRHPARPGRGQRPAHLRVHGRRRGARRRKGAGPQHAHSHTIVVRHGDRGG